MFALILAALCFIIWLILTCFRGFFWRLTPFDDDRRSFPPPQHWPRVAAIIPARNEAVTIQPVIESLLAQHYPGELQIFLIDDHSDDPTASLAQQAALSSPSTNRLRILQASPPPSGWTGKLWALQNGIEAAQTFVPDYFWFSDADITHTPDTLRRLVSRASSHHLDLTSLMVLLQARTFPERLLIPPFLYFFLQLYPPEWIADPNSRTAGAAGGCILLCRDALDRIGGISTIRNQVIDDCALARAIKRADGKLWMGLTRKSISLRSYSTFAEIRDLVARTAFTQLRYSPLLLLGTIAGMLLTYLVPVILTFSTHDFAWRLSLGAWVLMTLTYLPTVSFYLLSPFWSPLLPAAAGFYSYATLLSALRYWSGRGGQWKGRSQAPTSRR